MKKEEIESIIVSQTQSLLKEVREYFIKNLKLNTEERIISGVRFKDSICFLLVHPRKLRKDKELFGLGFVYTQEENDEWLPLRKCAWWAKIECVNYSGLKP